MRGEAERAQPGGREGGRDGRDSGGDSEDPPVTLGDSSPPPWEVINRVCHLLPPLLTRAMGYLRGRRSHPEIFRGLFVGEG